MALLPSLIFATMFLGANYVLPPPNANPDCVKVAGYTRCINATATIRIPMEEIPEDEPPSMVLFRSLEGWSKKRLRLTGERALVQFGEELRELMLWGADLFHPQSLAPSDDKNKHRADVKIQLFQAKIREMAPWLKGDPTEDPTWPINQVPSPYKVDPSSKAVVICAGDRQKSYLDALLHAIRNIHRSTIPIRIAYKGDADLSLETREQLSMDHGSRGDLRFLDLSTLFALDREGVQLKGWNLKPLAMLAVPEAQVALLDADVLLFQPPEALFESMDYNTVGAHFFRDRSDGEHLWTPRQFLLSMQPRPSSAAQRALVNGNVLNEHIQEAGVVVIDKSRRWRGLWTACLILGRSDVRRFLQRDVIFGEKEVYFTAFETIHEPYAFATYYPGVIGNIMSDFHGDELEWEVDASQTGQEIHGVGSHMALCGRMLHFDDKGLSLWSNGGYLTREDDRSGDTVASRGLKPLLFVDGGLSTVEGGGHGKEGNQNWRFHHGLGVLCLFPNKRSIQKVQTESAEKGGQAVDYYVLASGLASQQDS